MHLVYMHRYARIFPDRQITQHRAVAHSNGRNLLDQGASSQLSYMAPDARVTHLPHTQYALLALVTLCKLLSFIPSQSASRINLNFYVLLCSTTLCFLELLKSFSQNEDEESPSKVSSPETLQGPRQSRSVGVLTRPSPQRPHCPKKSKHRRCSGRDPASYPPSDARLTDPQRARHCVAKLPQGLPRPRQLNPVRRIPSRYPSRCARRCLDGCECAEAASEL